MKTIHPLHFIPVSFFSALLLLFATGCENHELVDPSVSHEHAVRNPSTKTTTYYGPAVPVGGGIARVRAEVSRSGESISLGVVLSEKAVTNLPHEMASYELTIPKQAGPVPFDHVSLDWNPHGHEPDNIYTHPHFDLHFYSLSKEERATIGFNDPLAELLPEPRYLPAAYIPLPGSIPMMGKHWIDPASPELHGQHFTQTFIWGTYNRKVAFLEPMITLDYLLSKQNKSFDLQQPEAYQQAGKYYPTRYSIGYEESRKQYTVDLLGLTRR
ncbi:DUF5602 domain-containing protein [soil metagenome]